MGFFKKLFGASDADAIREDGLQQLEAILHQNISTFKNDSLWVAGKAANETDTVYLLVTDIKFCYVYQVKETNGEFALAKAFVTSEKELTGFDYRDNGDSVTVYVYSMNGRVDFNIEPVIGNISGKVKIDKSQSKELTVLKNIIFPNYRSMCKEKKTDKSSLYEISEIVSKLPDSVRKEIKDFIEKDEKIQAIAILRSATGYGLKEAKELAERQEFYEML